MPKNAGQSPKRDVAIVIDDPATGRSHLEVEDGDAFGDMTGHWCTRFILQHRDTIRKVEALNLEDPTLQGSLPFTRADLERVLARTDEIKAWVRRFESCSGNPFWAIALVEAWPEGDAQECPRLVTAYWPLDRGEDLQEMREASRELAERFAEEPMKCPVIKGAEYWELASRELFLDPED